MTTIVLNVSATGQPPTLTILHCSSVAECWRLKLEVSWVRLPAAASLFTFLYFHLLTSKFLHVHAPSKLRSASQFRRPRFESWVDFLQQTLHFSHFFLSYSIPSLLSFSLPILPTLCIPSVFLSPSPPLPSFSLLLSSLPLHPLPFPPLPSSPSPIFPLSPFFTG